MRDLDVTGDRRYEFAPLDIRRLFCDSGRHLHLRAQAAERGTRPRHGGPEEHPRRARTGQVEARSAGRSARKATEQGNGARAHASLEKPAGADPGRRPLRRGVQCGCDALIAISGSACAALRSLMIFWWRAAGGRADRRLGALPACVSGMNRPRSYPESRQIHVVDTGGGAESGARAARRTTRDWGMSCRRTPCLACSGAW